MNSRLLLLVLALPLVFSTGCSLLRRDRKPKESSAIASEVEATFRQRWIDKRVSELTAQGVAAEAARAQAQGEFRARFGATLGDKK